MCRVLVIDDEEDVVKAVSRRLSREGIQVESAISASEGIERLSSALKPFDVIISDMSMDDANAGLRVLHAAFARDLFAEVIVMTAFGNVANAVECMKRGAFDYVEKNQPGVDVYDQLAEKVGEAMERRRRDVRTVELWEQVAKVKQ